MCSYPGGTWNLDFRQGFPKPVQEYFVALLPQSDIHHLVHMQDGRALTIPPPKTTKTFPRHQPSQSLSAEPAKDFGETVRGPLGSLVHARSGDKGSNANVGFWVRHPDEYDWMRALLSTETMKDLLAKEYNGKQIASRNLHVPLARLIYPRTDSNCRKSGLSTFFCMITLTEVSAAQAPMIF